MSETPASMTGGGKALISRIRPQAGQGNLYSYVVDGATCTCNAGSAPGRLSLPHSHGVAIKNKPVLNDRDNQGIVNIGPMGTCKKTDGACRPECSGPWGEALESLHIDKYPALINRSQIVCDKGGIISMADDGQT